MINRIVNKIIIKQFSIGILSDEDTDIYRYGYTIAIEVILNICIALGIGIILNEIICVILFLGMFITLRSFAGGYHTSQQWSCVILSNVAITAAVVFSKFAPDIPDSLFLITVELLCIAIILLLAPMQNPAKELSNKQIMRYGKYTKLVLGVEALLQLIFITAGHDKHASIILAVFIIQTISLITIWIKQSVVTKR